MNPKDRELVALSSSEASAVDFLIIEAAAMDEDRRLHREDPGLLVECLPELN